MSRSDASAVNAAGRVLRRVQSSGTDFPTRAELDEALAVIARLKVAHQASMLGAEVKIRLCIQQDGEWLVDRASRIKRVSSIALKLHRRPTMRLTQMQDITGHRVVLGNQDAVNRVRDRLLESWTAEQVKIDDYVAQPRNSGEEFSSELRKHPWT